MKNSICIGALRDQVSTNGSTRLQGIESVAQTDGERFVIMIEDHRFAGEFGVEKRKLYSELIQLSA